MRIAPKRPAPAFTLIEIMIVIAIIGLLITMALPSFMAARKQPQKSSCINNLRQIDAAKQTYAVEHGVTALGGAPSREELQPYIGRGGSGTLPTCPLDQAKSFETSYQINDMQTAPACLIDPDTHVLK